VWEKSGGKCLSGALIAGRSNSASPGGFVQDSDNLFHHGTALHKHLCQLETYCQAGGLQIPLSLNSG
jgi:hypothetical protein